MPYAQTLMTSDANGTYRGVYTYGLDRIAERDLVAVEGVPNDPLYYLYDGRGSVTQLVNTENHVRDKYRYTPFGVQMPGGQLTPNTRLFNNPYGYNGEDYDIESGLQFLRARYYNPETARFISRDSYLGDVTEPLSLNRYAYTVNNPLKYTDPSGHEYRSQDEGNEFVDMYNNLYRKSLGQSTIKQPTLGKEYKDASTTEVLQSMLRDLGYYLGPSGVDGIYGDYTRNAIKDFQRDNNLQVDGIAGPKTWDKLQRKHTDYENVESVREAEKRDYAAKQVRRAEVISADNFACGDGGESSSGAGSNSLLQFDLDKLLNPGSLLGTNAGVFEFAGEAGKEFIPNAIRSTARPDNIGVGTWRVYIEGQASTAASDLGNVSKVAKGVGYAAVGVDVGLGIFDNVRAGSPAKKVVSDAAVDTAFGAGGVGASVAAGALAGSAVPIGGNIVGAGVGLGVGLIYTGVTEVWQPGDKSIKDRVKEGIYNFFK